MSNQHLGFDWQEEPGTPGDAPQLSLAAKLTNRLGSLTRRGVYLGTSSWKYPGWLEQVYESGRYQRCGRFSQKNFERECLAEYATVFHTVCGDFAN